MKKTLYRRWGKRVIDIGASLVALLFVSPILLVIAIFVKAASPGPVLYRQQRVGLEGRMFDVTKFRTMIRDADKAGPSITSSSDPRITPIGRWLRRMKLDELPQLWNVLKGEMSLVGPRPEVPGYVESYSTAQRRVLSVRPGITDPASIAYRNEEELLARRADVDRYYREVVLPDKLNMNLLYLERMSLLYDLSLLLRTATAIFTAHPYVLHEDH